MSPDEFAATIKAKYPQYQNIDNATLTQQVITKYPQYASQVKMPSTAVDGSEENAVLPVTADENPLAPTSVLKGAVNTIPDAFKFLKGIVSQPAKIASDVSAIAAPNENQNAVKVNAADVAKEIPGQILPTLASLIPDALKHLFTGNFAQAGRDLENAPVSTVVPTIGGLEGGASVLDDVTGLGKAATDATARNMARTAATVDGPGFTMAPEPLETVPTTFKQNVSNGLSTIASPFTSLLSKAGDAVGDTVASLTGFLTGLKPEDVKNIFNNPKDYSNISESANSRDALAGDLNSAINKRLSDLSSTGEGYNPIRQDTATQVQVPENFLPNIFKKYGFSIDGDGKIIADTNSLTRSPADINALQHFYDTWKNSATMTPNEFLNMRGDIGKIAKFGRDIGHNTDAATVGKDIYAQANGTMRPQIPNLKTLDATYAPEKNATTAMKKEFFNKDGTLKDSVGSKIANATKDGKEAVLQRLESIMPGVTKRIEILNTAEAIVKAKKGGFFHSVGEGLAVHQFASGLPSIISAIVTHPSFAIPLLKGLGLSAAQVGVVTDTLTGLAGKISSNPLSASMGVPDAQQKKQ